MTWFHKFQISNPISIGVENLLFLEKHFGIANSPPSSIGLQVSPKSSEKDLPLQLHPPALGVQISHSSTSLRRFTAKCPKEFCRSGNV